MEDGEEQDLPEQMAPMARRARQARVVIEGIMLRLTVPVALLVHRALLA